MPFLFLLFLALACLPEAWAAPWIGISSPALSTALTWLSMAASPVLAFVIAWRVQRLVQLYPYHRDVVARRYSTWRRYHIVILCLTFAVGLYVFGWGWAVQTFCGQEFNQMPGAELLTLTPFLAALFLSRLCFYDADRALHDTTPGTSPNEPFWSRQAYVAFHVRQSLALIFIPVLLLIVLKGLPRLLPDDSDAQLAASLLGLAGSVLVFLGMPWILRLALGLKPLPEGPLRDRLLAASRRLNFRCSNLLLWSTRNHVGNAMVAGIIPNIRYVLFTDRLLNELTPEEVEAVFGHEIGHVKHGHMLYYLSFLMLSLMVLWLATPGLTAYLGLPPRPDLEALPLVAVLGVYILLVFGFLSRRCERQADIYGCRAVSCTQPDCNGHDERVVLAPVGAILCRTGIQIFIEALEKVASINGISRDRPGYLQSWQHSTIARRVEFLQRMLADPSVEPRFQRTVAFVKWGLLLGLAAALLLLICIRWDDLQEASDKPPEQLSNSWRHVKPYEKSNGIESLSEISESPSISAN